MPAWSASVQREIRVVPAVTKTVNWTGPMSAPAEGSQATSSPISTKTSPRPAANVRPSAAIPIRMRKMTAATITSHNPRPHGGEKTSMPKTITKSLLLHARDEDQPPVRLHDQSPNGKNRRPEEGFALKMSLCFPSHYLARAKNSPSFGSSFSCWGVS